MKFLHLADVHLGMENYGRIDPSTGLHTRLKDFIECFSFAIDIALEEKVDLVIFTGDAYKNSNPNPTHQREFAHQIYRLSEAEIPVVMINGNHDNPVSFGKATSLEIFDTLNVSGVKVVIEPELFNIETKAGPVQVFGLPWPTKNLFLSKKNIKILLMRKLLRKLRKEAKESSKQKDRLVEKWREANQRLKDKDIWQQKLSKAYLEREESTQAGKLIVSLQEEIKKLEKTIQEKKYALEEQKRLKEIEGQIKNIGYDKERHRKLNRKIEELSNAPLEKAKLEEAEKKIDFLRDGLSELKENYQQKELNLKDLEKKKDKIRVELKELPFLKEKLVQEEQVLMLNN